MKAGFIPDEEEREGGSLRRICRSPAFSMLGSGPLPPEDAHAFPSVSRSPTSLLVASSPSPRPTLSTSGNHDNQMEIWEGERGNVLPGDDRPSGTMSWGQL